MPIETTSCGSATKLTAREAFDKLTAEYQFHTVLDVGCGPEALHSLAFHKMGKTVTAIDIQEPARDFQFKYICGDTSPTKVHKGYPAVSMEGYLDSPFDALWVAHVLEHQRDVFLFLRQLHHDLREGGVLAITVPPMRKEPRLHEMVGGHLTRWDAGVLCYNLVLAGFDCSQARIKQYKYNLSVIVEKHSITLPADLHYDCGDIEKLAAFIPAPLRTERCSGDVQEWNW